MPSVTSSIDIAAPPGKVFDLIADPSRYPELADPTERMISWDDGPMRTGYAYKEYGGIKPFMAESEWQVVEWDPPKRTVHVGDDGSATMRLTCTAEPSDGGCRYSQDLSMEVRWYLKVPMAILWPLMMRSRAQKAMDKTVANVKRLVEPV